MSYFMNPIEMMLRTMPPGMMRQPAAQAPQQNQGALQTAAPADAPMAPPIQPPIQPPIPPPAQAASNLVAAAPQRGGYSPSVAAALARNQPNLQMGSPAPGAPPVQPQPFNHPTPLAIPPPAPAGALAGADPSQTPGMIAAKAAGNPKGGLSNGMELALWGGLDPFGLGKKNSTAIQDIGRAMSQGKTITDAQWAAANYGPGGK